MAYDEALADIFRDDLAAFPDVTEKKMFGGLCFLRAGHMLCGVHRDKSSSEDLAMFRVGPEDYEAALGMPYVSELAFTGRPMRGMVQATSDIFDDEETRLRLVRMGLTYTGGMPPK